MNELEGNNNLDNTITDKASDKEVVDFFEKHL